MINEANRLIDIYSSSDLIINDESGYLDLQDTLKKVKKIKNRVRKERLNDSQGFKKGQERVNEWFERVEKPLKYLEDKIKRRFDEYVSQIEVLKKDQEELTDRGNIDESNYNLGTAGPNNSPIITVSKNPEELNKNKNVENIKTKYELDTFNKHDMDLNELKEYFSDYQIKISINKHLRISGPDRLKGVTYKVVADLK